MSTHCGNRHGVATPAPANSALVYQVIQPSLVWIQVEEKHQQAESDFGLGSGVVVDNFGNILTNCMSSTARPLSKSHLRMVRNRRRRSLIRSRNDLAVLQALDTPLPVVPVFGHPIPCGWGMRLMWWATHLIVLPMSSGVSGFDPFSRIGN